MEARSHLSQIDRKKLDELFQNYGFTDYKRIEPEKIIVAQWVRMKCLFGCPHYGIIATCPPNIPSVSECERFFREYKNALIFHFENRFEKPEDRIPWTKEIDSRLVALEREVFLSGYEKVFLLAMGSCRMCIDCPGEKEQCIEPLLARSTPEAMGVNVYATVRQFGYHMEVLRDYSEKMNRYTFLMVE